nr:alanine--tRNA ligase [Anaerolineae bacterium]
MNRMTSAEVRQSFLDFFAARGHTIVPSASLIPVDDPTLLFTNAGMNQFKDVFLGLGTRPYTRAADTQKCMRVSGKHNDLEDVGRDGYHHTFFEMLGNWSFGDYYKKEAIAWAWELLTEVWGLPKERLWVTVFKDELGELETDEEAAGYWRSETDISHDHVLYFGRKDNFWEMADTGPCGPCSEIHYDRGLHACTRQGKSDHICQVNGDCGRFIELWNLVFIQYNKDADGTLHPLPAKHVDTGAGFERLVAVLQGVDSNYKTDLFTPIIRRVQEMAGHTDAEVDENIVAYRVIADHGRAIAFLIGDGVLPGNEGRNYVLRMILRRAARFGRKLGFTRPFLAEVAKVVIEVMGSHFPELANRRRFILTTITQEEERFLRTLDLGLTRLDEVLAELEVKGERSVPGDAAFRLYDTFGLPLEITRDVARERGLSVDEAGYQVALEEQRRRARRAEPFEVPDEETLARYQKVLADLQKQGLLGKDGVEHDPYTVTELETTVAAILRDGEPTRSAKEGDQVEVVLPATCFYVEAGGQVSDTGFIAAYPPEEDEPIWEIGVQDVRRLIPGLIVHIGVVTQGRPRVGDTAWAVVDYERRMDIARNHTATHLLHSELRYILG